jgi:hypothetical protein
MRTTLGLLLVCSGALSLVGADEDYYACLGVKRNVGRIPKNPPRHATRAAMPGSDTIAGCNSTADAAELKKAYRKLALKW